MASEASQSISLKILIDKEKNQFKFGELNDDLADVIFSFLTIPIGTIIKLTRGYNSRAKFGCLNNLYRSVEKLGEKYLMSMHKEILLHPRSAAEIYCRRLKIDLNERENSTYYRCCNDCGCKFLSYYPTAYCRCGHAMGCWTTLAKPIPQDRVFVKPNTCFMVTDDFRVFPSSTAAGLHLLIDSGTMDGSKLEQRTINMEKEEVLKLLMHSLVSRAPFSDLILDPCVGKTNGTNLPGENVTGIKLQFQKILESSSSLKINLKLIINKSTNRALYAEVKENFVDFLCSFLLFPISCLPFEGCIGNLYKSVQDLDSNYLKSEEMKEFLVNPKLPPGLSYGKLIGIEEGVSLTLSTLASLYRSRDLQYLSSNVSLPEEAKIGSGFIKGPSMFMVTDNLSITPLSPISGLCYLGELKVPLSQVGQMDVTMGEKEALDLLMASFVSTSALTDVFLPKEIEEVNPENPENPEII